MKTKSESRVFRKVESIKFVGRVRVESLSCGHRYIVSVTVRLAESRVCGDCAFLSLKGGDKYAQ